jgi:indolepyruvate ferredoxin oxidoreductase alpha subunit
MHQRLQTTMQEIQAQPGQSLLNGIAGQGSQGVLAAGFAYHKLKEVLDQSQDPPLSLLHLGTLNPLPEGQIADFMRKLDAVLVLEETAPFIETQVQALAQRAGLHLPVYGRSSGHLPGAGEIFGHHIVEALTDLLPAWPWPIFEQDDRGMPSRQPLCDDCPYIPTFQALLSVLERHGGRDAFIVTGETGCMVRAQLPPWELLDAKYAMGSSIGLAAGLARTGVPQKIVALSGDSALLHSGLGELIDAAQAGISLLVVVLANETTALSGGQPHPGTLRDTQGRPRQPVDLYALAQAAGADMVLKVDPEEREATESALEEGLTSDGLAVVIARRACPLWE